MEKFETPKFLEGKILELKKKFWNRKFPKEKILEPKIAKKILESKFSKKKCRTQNSKKKRKKFRTKNSSKKILEPPPPKKIVERKIPRKKRESRIPRRKNCRAENVLRKIPENQNRSKRFYLKNSQKEKNVDANQDQKTTKFFTWRVRNGSSLEESSFFGSLDFATSQPRFHLRQRNSFPDTKSKKIRMSPYSYHLLSHKKKITAAMFEFVTT